MNFKAVSKVKLIQNKVCSVNIAKWPFILTSFAVLALSLLFACNSGEGKGDSGGRLLAKVYNKSLYLSEMEGMLPEGITSEDSSLIINAYVENWLRETSLLHEAEKNIPKDINIDRLVKDYRSSLIKHNYENILVNEFLDSLVSASELEEFYQKNKEQYQLETPIIRCLFIKAPLNSAALSDAQRWWNGGKPDDLADLKRWSNSHAVVQHLEENEWHKVDEIAAYMPKGNLTVDNVRKGQDFVQKDDGFVYFFKVIELVSRPEIAPLSYIEAQARKFILHKRKTQLLDEMKEKFYQEANRKKSVKIYQ